MPKIIMARTLCIYFFFLSLFTSCYRDVDRVLSTHEARFHKAFESLIDKNGTNTVKIVSKTKYEIFSKELQNIGYVTGPNESRLQIILVKSEFGLIHSPHGKGLIYIVKDKKTIGCYNGLMYNIKAYLGNGKLMVQSEKDCPFTEIDFSKEIPSNIFLLEDSCGGGNEYPFCKEEQTESY